MILTVLGFLLIYSFLYGELNVLSTSVFKVKTTKLKLGTKPIRIVHLSDLHAKSFGRHNQKLIRKIKQLGPDLIITTGDMISSTDTNGDAFLNIAFAFSGEIPMFYIEGNHELTAKYDTLNQSNGWYDDYLDSLEKLGVHILQNKSACVQIHGNHLFIHGLTVPLSHYYAVPDKIRYLEDVEPIQDVLDVLNKPDETAFNILLAHNPFLANIYEQYPSDLVCSGHVHGGAIRLPFVGGILSPERKLFPKYSSGRYKLKQKDLIVSRGLGRLRLFNRPEIVVIDLVTKRGIKNGKKTKDCDYF